VFPYNLFVIKTLHIRKKQGKIKYHIQGGLEMKKHIKTVNKAMINKTLRTGGCGECPASCQSACKTSCTVGNQVCEHK
jgi:predicted ribosomally synthesized six-cysteine peptide SCIFF